MSADGLKEVLDRMPRAKEVFEATVARRGHEYAAKALRARMTMIMPPNILDGVARDLTIFMCQCSGVNIPDIEAFIRAIKPDTNELIGRAVP